MSISYAAYGEEGVGAIKARNLEGSNGSKYITQDELTAAQSSLFTSPHKPNLLCKSLAANEKFEKNEGALQIKVISKVVDQ